MFNSIRITLTIWYLSILALIIIAFAFATYFLVKHNLNQTTNKNLSSMAKTAADDLLKEEKDHAEERRQLADEDEEDSEIQTLEEALKEEISDLNFVNFEFAVFAKDGKILASSISDGSILNELKQRSEDIELFSLKGKNKEFRIHKKDLKMEKKQFTLFTTFSLKEQNEFLTFLNRMFYITVPIALLLAGFGGYFLARRSLTPVVSMSQQAKNISSVNLNARLPIENENDELGSLAKVFNSLLSRLENSFTEQQRFMADASHELRTPLAIIRTESEIAISKDERDAKEYKESLAIVHDESKRLTNIVEDLFLLARADQGQLKPQMESVLLDEIITDAVHAARTLAEKRGVRVHFFKLPEMTVNADEALLHRLFLNLLDNAIKYNRPEGTISIDAKIKDEIYQVLVSDTGIGISRGNPNENIRSVLPRR